MEISIIYKKLRYLSNPNLLLQQQSSSKFVFAKTLISAINPNCDSSSATTQKYENTRFNGNHWCSRTICQNPSLDPLSNSSFRSVRIWSTKAAAGGGSNVGYDSGYRCFSSVVVSSGTTDKQPDRERLSRVVNVTSRSSRGSSTRKVDNVRRKVDSEKVSLIVELIKKEGNDMESELGGIDVIFSHDLVIEIFRQLNSDGVSGLRFFGWVREAKINFSRSSEFCSLIIDNLGRVDDYESMLLILKDFSSKGICVTEKAFGYLPVCDSDKSTACSSVMKVLEILNQAGGSARSSGIYGLIKVLCNLNLFDLAMFVMEETARRTSYYNVLIRAKCGLGKFEEVHKIYDEMRRFSCGPNTNSYNYLLSSLCKNQRLDEACNLLGVMEKFGYLPDAITFEVIIHHVSKLGTLDYAVGFLNEMMSSGIEPRLTTHAVFIKGYFYCDRFQEAHKYVVDMAIKHKCSAHNNYSLLASLHHKQGRLVDAWEILVDMIEKGMKPHFPIYIKVVKDLYFAGKKGLIADLKHRFSKFHPCFEVK